jgi:predicted dehydrogenase
MSARIRVGVVGTSWYAEMMHVVNIKAHPEADLCAICGRNRNHAEELAVKYTIPRVYTDYQDMIAHANLQALVVVTPDDLHYPVTMSALEAGLHVLCEKPLAMNSTQAKAMLDKAQVACVKHMVYMTNRWRPIYKYVRQLLDQDFIGRCYQVNIRLDGDYGNEYMWRFDRQRANGILGDLGSHMIDLAQWFVGDIDQVCGQLSTFINRPGPDGQPMDPANDAALMLLKFTNGAQGVIQVSAVAQMGDEGHGQEVILYGEKGTLKINNNIFGGNVEIRGIQRGEKEFHILEIPPDLFGVNNWTDPVERWFRQGNGDQVFIDAILSDRFTEPSFLTGYKIQVVMDAVKESDLQRMWLPIE